MLRKTPGLKHPELLRAFRAPYSKADLQHIDQRALEEFLRVHAPDKVDGASAERLVAMGRVLIDVGDVDAELAQAIYEEFGEDKIFLLHTPSISFAEALKNLRRRERHMSELERRPCPAPPARS